MAAASLALQWSPPPSSPLFDEHQQQQHQQGSRSSPSITTLSSPSSQQRPALSSPRPSSGRPSSGSTPGAGGSSVLAGSGAGGPSGSYFSNLPPSASSRNLAAASSPSATSRTPSPRPSTYAAAASSLPIPQQQRNPPQPVPSPSAHPHYHHHHQHQQHPNYSPQPRPYQGQQQYFAQHEQQQHQQQAPQRQPQPGWNGQGFAQMPQQGYTGAPQSQPRPQNPFGAPQGQPHYGHNAPGFQPAYNMAFAPPTMPNQYAWAQYQQMLAAQAAQYQQHAQMQQLSAAVGDTSLDGSAARQSVPSGPQRPTQALGYNDSFQAGHPGASYSSAVAGPAAAGGRGALPPGAMAPPLSGQGQVLGNPAFHPYRRQQTPQGSSAGTSSPSGGQASQAQLLPPASLRKRTPSTDSHESSSSRRDQAAPVGATENGSRIAAPASRSESTRSTSSGLGTGPNGSDSSLPHSRQDSTSSQNSSVYSSAAVSDKASTVGGRSTPTPASAYKKPSPLSRQPVPEREDDNETNASYGGSDRDESLINGRATPTPTTEKKKGFSGKLRKALSLSAVNELQQQQANNASVGSRPSAAPSGREMPTSMSSARMVSGPSTSSTIARPPSPTRSEFGAAASSAASISSRRGPRPPVSNSAGAATSIDGSGKRSLFNRKFNSSTDNISISSTVSSASVMLRKVGNLGKMARRHSLMGLTNMFNKDKEGGRDGLQTDDFGTLTPSASAATISANPKASAGMSRSASGNGKSDPAAASVSHATVELDPNVGDGSMTPAAHYVRQHQIQMRQQAEAEEKAARERQEAEARAAEAAAAAKSRTVLGATQGKTTDDVVESRQKMIEKEKERLKSKRTWRNRLRVGGSSVDLHASAAPTGLETIPATEPKTGTGSDAIAAPPQDVYPTSISAPSMSSHFPQDSISRGVGAESAYLDNDQDLLPPHMPAAGSGHGGEESGDEFETDSLRHWGEGIERSRASAALVKAPKGILKKSASSSQLSRFAGNGSGGDGPVSGAFDRPWTRVRASSYDAPQAAPAPGAPMLSALSTTSEGVDRMDGVARSPSPNAEAQRRPASSGEDDRPAHSPQPPSVPAFGHHSNSSMPTLTMMTNPTTGALPAPSHRPSMQKKRICFTEEHIYHSTWPAHVYDRRGELATCNRLTPLLAQRIKEELNSFKMEEMEVAPSSRIYTHFFV